jgi:hypothetical protein
MYWLHCWGVRPPAAVQIRSMAYWTFVFRRRIIPPWSSASTCPPGVNAIDPTGVPLPVRGRPSRRGCAGSATSHSQTVPSPPPLASTCPPELNATDLTAAAPLVRGLAEQSGVREADCAVAGGGEGVVEIAGQVPTGGLVTGSR